MKDFHSDKLCVQNRALQQQASCFEKCSDEHTAAVAPYHNKNCFYSVTIHNGDTKTIKVYARILLGR